METKKIISTTTGFWIWLLVGTTEFGSILLQDITLTDKTFPTQLSYISKEQRFNLYLFEGNQGKTFMVVNEKTVTPALTI